MNSNEWDVPATVRSGASSAGILVTYPDGNRYKIPVPEGMTPREYAQAIVGLGDGHKVDGYEEVGQ